MGQRNGARGASLVEFSFVVIPFLALFVAAFDVNLTIHVRTVLRNAVREGARFAATSQTAPGMGQDAAVRQAVKKASLGYLTSSDLSKIEIRYFSPSGVENGENKPGNLVVVQLNGFEWHETSPLLRPGKLVPMNVSALDVVEKFTGTPPTR